MSSPPCWRRSSAASCGAAGKFFGYTGKADAAFNFRRRRNGIVVAFSAEDWRDLGELVSKGLALPELQPALEDSTLPYGEV